MTKHYKRIVNTGESEKRIPKQFRLQPHVLDELQSLADDSEFELTYIVELAIMNVRPLVLKTLKSRADALEKSGALRKASPNQLKVLSDSVSSKLLKKSTNS